MATHSGCGLCDGLVAGNLLIPQTSLLLIPLEAQKGIIELFRLHLLSSVRAGMLSGRHYLRQRVEPRELTRALGARRHECIELDLRVAVGARDDALERASFTSKAVGIVGASQREKDRPARLGQLSGERRRVRLAVERRHPELAVRLPHCRKDGLLG